MNHRLSLSLITLALLTSAALCPASEELGLPAPQDAHAAAPFRRLPPPVLPSPCNPPVAVVAKSVPEAESDTAASTAAPPDRRARPAMPVWGFAHRAPRPA